MKILITGVAKAEEFVPTDATYAIRIRSSNALYWPELTKSNLYQGEHVTVFDDIWPQKPETKGEDILFSPQLAETLLREFSGVHKSIDTLLIHCTQGRNRSPAVGLALNEVFELGYDTVQFASQFRHTNWYVYNTLVQQATIRNYNTTRPGRSSLEINRGIVQRFPESIR